MSDRCRCLVAMLCVLVWSVGAAAQEPGVARPPVFKSLFAVNPLGAGGVSAAPDADDGPSADAVSSTDRDESGTPLASPQAAPTPLDAERRACDGCPQRSVGKA